MFVRLTGAHILESSLGKVGDADTLDGQNSTAFLGATAKAADADQLISYTVTSSPSGDRVRVTLEFTSTAGVGRTAGLRRGERHLLPELG